MRRRSRRRSPRPGGPTLADTDGDGYGPVRSRPRIAAETYPSFPIRTSRDGPGRLTPYAREGDRLVGGLELVFREFYLGSPESSGEGRVERAVPATAAAALTIVVVSLLYEGETFSTDRVPEVARRDVERLTAEDVNGDDRVALVARPPVACSGA